ncbi:hypothetical protein [Brevundimonas sp. GCM10030266]|uniref:hypothetical protein n=1 Tax=Brevundimonas sp. GCM10030266 TaxID=3273386 RepID=UPI003617E8CD
MSTYTLRLHHSSGVDPKVEPLDAMDEAEARELARVRLLLTRDYSQVELHRGGEALHVFSRD